MKPIDAIIFDIDGTLLDNSHRLHHIKEKPKDWLTYVAELDNDTPIPETVELLELLMEQGYAIILSTGRKESEREGTEAVFERYGIEFDELYMRPNGDNRRDDILKQENLDKIKLVYKPIMVFEDRTRCSEMYRNNGLKCYQIAKGDF